MGRAKIEMKRIENASSRQVTFSKRRAGLFKKANELAILCEAEVAVIIFSSTGKLFDFASSSMKKILSRYMKCLEWKRNPATTPKPENLQPNETDALKEEVEKLKSKQMQLLGKDIRSIGLQELHSLEEQLNQGLFCIKERKEQILTQQLKESKMQEQQVRLENETLRRQIEEIQSLLTPARYQTQLCIGYPSSSNAPIAEGSQSLEIEHNSRLPDEDSDTILHLGPPSGICMKGKEQNGSMHLEGTSWDHHQQW